MKGDATCPEVPERRDGEWVKVGGMIAACKKIKTRTGSTVMFATLDDLDGQVELLVFEKVIVATEDDPQARRDRARPRHRGPRGERQGLREGRRRRAVRPVRGGDRARARTRRRRWPPRAPRARCACASTPAACPRPSIDELKRIFEDFPGESEVVLEVHTRTGLRRLRFGEEFRVDGRDAALKAELHSVLGDAVLTAVPQPA